MRLHAGPRSGNSYKVRLLLGLAGIECEVVDYDPASGETRSETFVGRVNPAGQVPVLETDDGTMLPESGAILWYLAEGTDLVPESPLDRARVLRWMFFEQSAVLPSLGRPRLYRMRGVEMTPERVAEVAGLMQAGYRALGVMEGHLAGEGAPFFVGVRPTLADVALYAYTRLCHEGGYDLAPYPATRTFLEAVEGLPGYVPPPVPADRDL